MTKRSSVYIILLLTAVLSSLCTFASPISLSSDNRKQGENVRNERSATPLLLDILAEKKFHLIDYGEEEDKRNRHNHHHHHHRYHETEAESPYGGGQYHEIGYNHGRPISSGSFSGSSAQANAGSFSGNQFGAGGSSSQSQSNAASQSASFGFGPFQASFSSSQANSASFSGASNDGRYPFVVPGRPYGGY